MAFNVSYVIQAVDKFSEVAARVKQSMEGIQKTADDMSTKMAASAEKVTSLGKKLSLGITAPLAAVGGLALHAAAEQEKLNTQIENIVGSAEKAKQVARQLEKIKMSSPIDVSQVDDAALRLLVMGTSVDKVSGIITNFSKISAGTGESLNNLVEMFAVAQSGPEGMSRALTMMNRKVPVIEELQRMIKEKTGKEFSSKEIRKFASEGKISMDALQQAFANMTKEGGKFFNSIDKQSHTLIGSLQLLRNNFHRFQESIGEAIMSSVDLSGAILTVNNVLKDAVTFVQEFAKNNPELTKIIVIFAAIAAAVGPMLVGLGLAINGIIGIGKAVMFLSSPMGIMVAGIAAAVLALVYLYDKFEFIRTIINGVVRVIYDLITAFPTLTTLIAATALVLFASGRGALILQAGMALLRLATIAYAAAVEALPAILAGVRIAMLLLNLAFAASPIGFLVTILAALAAGIVYLANKFSWLDASMKFVKDTALAIAGAFKEIFSFDLGSKLTALKGMASSGIDKIKGMFSGNVPTIQPLINNNVGNAPTVQPLINPNIGLGAGTIKSESQSSVDINVTGAPGIIESIKSKTDGKTNLAVTQNMAYGGY